MLAEIFKAVWEKAERSVSPIVQIPNCPLGGYFLRKEDGSLDPRLPAAPWAREKAFSIAGLKGCLDLHLAGNRAVVFYNHEKIRVLFNPDEPRESATMSLTLTPQAQRILKIEGVEQLAQPAAIMLFDCVLTEHTPKVVPALRSIVFGKNEEGESVLTHGKASLGKSVTAKMNGSEPVPESVLATIEVFEQIPSPTTVTLKLFADAEKACFRVYVNAGTYARMIMDACDSFILPELQKAFGDSAKLIYGAPTPQ